jgi:hypothetical protein
MKFRLLIIPFMALSLVGCKGWFSSTATTAQQISQAAQDVALLTGGLKAALPLVAQATKLDAATTAKVQAGLTDLQNLSNQLAAASTAAAAQGIVQLVEADVNSVISSLASAQNLPPNVQQILQAAAVMLPTVEALLNMTVLPAPTVTPPTAVAAAAPMTQQQAVQVLINATVTH